MPATSRRRKGSLIVADKTDYIGSNKRAVAFDVLYKGERVVVEPSGDQVVRDVIAQFDDYETLGKKISSKESVKIADAEGCKLVIAPERIVTVHKKQQQRLVTERPSDVSFACHLPANKSKEYETFAYIAQNLKLNMCHCHIFLVCLGDGGKLVQLFQKAKMEYEQISQREMSNPFMVAPNTPREVPTGLLFNKQIHRADLKAIEVIGSGQFGAVYLATQVMRKCPVDGKLFAIDGHMRRHMEQLERQGMTVDKDAHVEKLPIVRAVKMLKGSATPAAKEEFLREAEVMLMFEHDNVTVIQGVAVQQAPWLYVLEYCMYGDLKQVLKTCIDRKFMLTPAEQLHLALGILSGMEHIASKGCIHLDLAARNCLLAENNIVKVADFGLTRKLEKGENVVQLLSKGLKLAIKWLAPESLRKRQFSQQSDIWALGVTLWELYSYGAMPYGDRNNDECQKLVIKGEILNQPKSCPPSHWDLIKAMFAFEPADRNEFTYHKERYLELQNEIGTEVRDVGKSLNDPALEKKAREQRRKDELLRKQKVEAAMKAMANLIFEASKEQSIWWQQMMSKADADQLVLANPPGAFVIRQDQKNRLQLVIHEKGAPQSYPIKIEPIEDGTNSYIFAGRPHKNPAEIIGNLRYTPFQGRSGQHVKLTVAATVAAKSKSKRSSMMAKRKNSAGAENRTPSSTTSPVAAFTTGSAKGNPLFFDDGADAGNISEEDL